MNHHTHLAELISYLPTSLYEVEPHDATLPQFLCVMKSSILLFIATYISLLTAAASTDTVRVYYNSKWQETTRDSAGYFRKYWKDGALWQARDYFISGQLQMSGTYSDDSLNVAAGDFTFYHDNGAISQTVTFVQDKEEGWRRDWYDDGKRQSETFFKAGQADGLNRRWYPDGKLADSNNFSAGKLAGYQVWYYENGNKSEEGIYEDDTSKNVSLLRKDGTPDPDGKPGMILPSFREISGWKLENYLTEQLRYPEKARRKGLEGKAKVDFIVKESGEITDVKILKSSGVELLDAEALRVVRHMAPWNPGRNHNRPVSVIFTLPITFQLD